MGMTKNQYRFALESLGWTQVKAAHFFKVDTRTSRRWALGEVPIPESVAKVLRYLVKHPRARLEDFDHELQAS
jgi:hypothetical protein